MRITGGALGSRARPDVVDRILHLHGQEGAGAMRYLEIVVAAVIVAIMLSAIYLY